MKTEKIIGDVNYININSWQICPLCYGAFQIVYICSLCLGEKIISTISGKPPSEHNKLNAGATGIICGKNLEKPIPPSNINLREDEKPTI